MHHPIKRATVLLLLLSGSAALILGSVDSSELRDVSPMIPTNGAKPLIAIAGPEQIEQLTPVIVAEPPVALEPIPLAAPIPLPPPLVRTTYRRKAPTRSTRTATRTMRMLVTAYCPCRKCCGKFSDNITANGKSIYANNSMFVAADTRLLKFGTILSIPGYKGGRDVPVWDRGGKIRGHHIDVFFQSHKQAQKWGKQYLNVKVRVK